MTIGITARLNSSSRLKFESRRARQREAAAQMRSLRMRLGKLRWRFTNYFENEVTEMQINKDMVMHNLFYIITTIEIS